MFAEIDNTMVLTIDSDPFVAVTFDVGGFRTHDCHYTTTSIQFRLFQVNCADLGSDIRSQRFDR